MVKHHPDTERKKAAERWCSLVTPVLKSAWTAQAFSGGSECLQVFGGHGYVREWGIEQNVRDSRVAMIYEGTNEIQAIDLLVRKVLSDGGAGMALLMTSLEQVSEYYKNNSNIGNQYAGYMPKTLIKLTEELVLANRNNAELAFWVADDYLRAVALTLMAWAWQQIESAVDANKANSTLDTARWQQPAEALRYFVMPEFDMRVQIIQARLTQSKV